MRGRRLCALLLVISSLAGCAAPSAAGAPTAAPEATPIPIIPTPALPDDGSTATPLPIPVLPSPTADPNLIPEPPQEIIGMGQDVQVGAWTVRVHEVLRSPLPPPAPGQPVQPGQVIAVDVSVRNDTTTAQAWNGSASKKVFSLVAPDRQYVVLSYDPTVAAVPGLLDAIPYGITCPQPASAANQILQAYENGGVGDILIPPGFIFRTWIVFRAPDPVPERGLMLQMRVPAGKNQTYTLPFYRARFSLDGNPRRESLELLRMPVEDRDKPVEWQNLRLMPGLPAAVQEGMPSNGTMALSPCGQHREVAVFVTNLGEKSVPAPRTVWLVDADGRYYRKLVDTPIDLDPAYDENLTFVFPALFGGRDRPLGLVLNSSSPADAVFVPITDDQSLTIPPAGAPSSGTVHPVTATAGPGTPAPVMSATGMPTSTPSPRGEPLPDASPTSGNAPGITPSPQTTP